MAYRLFGIFPCRSQNPSRILSALYERPCRFMPGFYSTARHGIATSSRLSTASNHEEVLPQYGPPTTSAGVSDTTSPSLSPSPSPSPSPTTKSTSDEDVLPQYGQPTAPPASSKLSSSSRPSKSSTPSSPASASDDKVLSQYGPSVTPPKSSTSAGNSKSSLRWRGTLSARSGHDLFKNGKLTIDPIVLRDSCRCEQCVDQSTKQRNFQFSDIPLNIGVRSFERRVSGQEHQYIIEWKNDIPGFQDHTSIYRGSLVSRLLARGGLSKVFQRPYLMERVTWDKVSFSENTNVYLYDEFMNDPSVFQGALTQLHKYGLLMLKDVPEKESSVADIAQRIGPLYNSFYGSTWNVRSVPQSKNVAYTSKYLGFHMDLLYMKEPPAVQFLHCLRNSCTGGESRFVDTLRAIAMLMQEHPQDREILQKFPVRYSYMNDGFYYSDIKPILQRCSSRNTERKVKVSDNSSSLNMIENVFWSPPFMDNIVKSSDVRSDSIDVKRFISASKRFAEILERPDLVVEKKMNPGECAIFSNLRVAHARNSFDTSSGERWLRGTYVGGQDMLSKLAHILTSKHIKPDGVASKRGKDGPDQPPETLAAEPAL